jgi:hypothetical protein
VAKALSSGQMDDNSKDNFRRESCMAMDSTSGKMGVNMKDSTKKTRNMDKALTPIQTVRNIRVTGKKECSMELDV